MSETKRDLYTEAARVGKRQAVENGDLLSGDGHRMSMDERVLYWTARHAAREASGALLEAAKRLGLSKAQREALRVVAADVAYD